MAKRLRRKGATETFSVSVDPATRRILKAEADRNYSGNVSALVTDIANEAQRRAAAGDLLRWFEVQPMSSDQADVLEATLEARVKRSRVRKTA